MDGALAPPPRTNSEEDDPEEEGEGIAGDDAGVPPAAAAAAQRGGRLVPARGRRTPSTTTRRQQQQQHPSFGEAHATSPPQQQDHESSVDHSTYFSPAEQLLEEEEQSSTEEATAAAAAAFDIHDNDENNDETEREPIIAVTSEDEFDELDNVSEEGSGVLVEKPPSDDPSSSPIHQQQEQEQQQQQLAFPVHKLQFFTDHQSVPTQLHDLQAKAARQRHVGQTRLHNLHCRTAALTAQLAAEQMDCDAALRRVVDTGVYRPLQEAFERWSLHTHQSSASSSQSQAQQPSPPSQQWMALEQRVSHLDAQMTHAVHVRLGDIAHAPQRAVADEIAALAEQQSSEGGRRDADAVTTARRWESLAGVWARRYQEERAARHAAVADTAERLRRLELDAHRGQELLDEIAALQARVDKERESSGRRRTGGFGNTLE